MISRIYRMDFKIIAFFALNFINPSHSRSLNSFNLDNDYDTVNNIYQYENNRIGDNFRGNYGMAKQDDGGSVVGILTPMPELGIPPIIPPARNYLPNLDFWADFGQLFIQRSAISPFVKLSRVIFESQECAELVSCSVSKMSKRHSPLQFFHTLLTDFPFDGDLAKRLKMGSVMSERREDCGFSCSPFNFLNQSIETLNLLHKVMAAAKK